jgi:hypothetical protein
MASQIDQSEGFLDLVRDLPRSLAAHPQANPFSEFLMMGCYVIL